MALSRASRRKQTPSSKRSEFTSCENELAAAISKGSKPRMLVVCDRFGGWERGEDWNNLVFMFTHGNKIVKIAIVGAGTKEEELKAFNGAGMRPTPVRFFTPDELPDAETWLLEQDHQPMNDWILRGTQRAAHTSSTTCTEPCASMLLLPYRLQS